MNMRDAREREKKGTEEIMWTWYGKGWIENTTKRENNSYFWIANESKPYALKWKDKVHLSSEAVNSHVAQTLVLSSTTFLLLS